MFLEFLESVFKCLINFCFCISTDVINSLRVAIKNNDSIGLVYLIESKFFNVKNIDILKKASRELLPICYYRNNFVFSEKLIKAGALFKSDYITYSKFHKVSSIIDHLESIKHNVTEIEMLRSTKIVNAMEFPLLALQSNQSFFNVTQIFLGISYTDNKSYFSSFKEMYKDFVESDNLVISGLANFLGLVNYPEQKIKILTPIFNNTRAAFHHYILDLIYTPLSNFDSFEKSVLIHEIARYIMYELFENEGYPFKKGNIQQKQKYDEAAYRALCKIG